MICSKYMYRLSFKLIIYNCTVMMRRSKEIPAINYICFAFVETSLKICPSSFLSHL